MRTEILNSKGQPIRLTHQEQASARIMQAKFDNEIRPVMAERNNALGAEIDMTTLTQLLKSITEQKFFTIPFADYVPVVVGEGSWATEVLKFRDFSIGDKFETGIVNTGSSKGRLAEVDAGVDAIRTPIVNWAKQINWSFMDMMMAARAGSWDLVTSKEKSRKRNWDLGIQEIAFWGSENITGVKGLLTLAGVNSNTTVITKYIKNMSAAEFQAFLAGLLEAYRANSLRTAMPTHFIIPEADFNGLATSVDETYPLKSRLERLLEAMRLMTQNPNFQVKPAAYADKATNAAITGLNKNRYVLFNYDDDTIRMDIPVDYTNTLQNTINGFNFENVGYGQFTGVQAYRPLEILYFDWT